MFKTDLSIDLVGLLGQNGLFTEVTFRSGSAVMCSKPPFFKAKIQAFIPSCNSTLSFHSKRRFVTNNSTMCI